MTRKTFPRALFSTVSTASLMARGPQVFYAPDEDGGGEAEPVDETPEEFREQPGDREPEPDAEGEPPPEGDEGEEGGEGEGEAPPEGEGEGEAPPEGEAEGEPEVPKAKDWRDRQIAKLRDREKAREAELEEARKELEAARALLAAAPEEREAASLEKTREEIRKEEAAKVREEAYVKRVNDGLVAMDEVGKKAFGESWDAQISQAAEVFGQEMAKRLDFLEALTDLPNNAAVYHQLTADPDKLEALLAMPPHKMGMELARLSDAAAKPKPKPVSRAPAPIRPIADRGVERTLEELLNDPKASQEEINRRLDAEERKRAKAH